MAKVKKQTVKKKVAPKRSGILGGLKPLTAKPGDEKLKISLYGKAGSGKSTAWSSFPGNILAIVCSGGRGTNELTSVPVEVRSRITPHYIKECDEILTLSEELQHDTYFDTVVLEHATGVQDLKLAEILGLSDVPVQRNWGMATRDQYGERAVNMKHYFRALFNLIDKHVVIVSQEAEVELDESFGDLAAIVPSVGPSLSKSVLAWFNPASNHIIRTFLRPKTIKKKIKVGKTVKLKEEVVDGEFDYCILTGPSNIYTTKLRVPRGQHKPEYVNGTNESVYETIQSIIKGEYKE